MLLKQTKIVATISDKRCEVDFIRQLFEAGMNVVRLNTAHLDFDGLDKLINNTRAVSNRIAILMDTKGPEVRTTASAAPIDFHAGDRVRIVGDSTRETTRECIAVSYPDFVRDVRVGVHVLIDDGDLELAVLDKTADALLCEVQNEATLGSRKSVNVPGVRINLPSLTERDRRNIGYAAATSAMPSTATSISSPTPSCATSRTCWTSRRYSTQRVATSASSPRLRTRRAWTTSTKSWRWPTA